jgi:hypothetical protein
MKYRKKPVTVEVVHWTGNNLQEVLDFIDKTRYTFSENEKGTAIYLDTLEGGHIASVGDWIIKGVKGEFYPCKPDIFEKTYEKVDINQ